MTIEDRRSTNELVACGMSGFSDRTLVRPTASRDTHLDEWTSLIERAAGSSKTFNWSVGSAQTTAHLARIDGKYFVVQFFKDGPRAGELATAFVPSNSQLTEMLRLIGH